MKTRLCSQCLIVGVLAAGLMLLPAPSLSDAPVDLGGSCLSLSLEGSVVDADPLNPGDIVGTLDAGALSCTGHPKNC